VGYKEMTDANEALVGGKMGECAVHLNKVMHMTPAKPASEATRCKPSAAGAPSGRRRLS
jgi:hypothetical protein